MKTLILFLGAGKEGSISTSALLYLALLFAMCLPLAALRIAPTGEVAEVTVGSLPANPAAEIDDPAGSISSFTSGISYHPTGDYALIWNNGNVFFHAGIMGNVTAQIVTAGGSSILGTQGIVFNPSQIASQALIWTPAKVYRRINGGLPDPVQEVMTAGGSISGVRGIVYNPNNGPYALIWTASNLYFYNTGTLTADVITDGMSAIGGTQGIVFNPQGADALVWTVSKVYRHTGNNPTAVQEIMAGGSINGVRGIVYDPQAAYALIWNADNVYFYIGTTTTQVVRDAGAAIAGTDGIVLNPLFGANQALIWTPAKVYRHTGSNPTAVQEVMAGGSIMGVRGIVYHPGGGYALMWNSGNLYFHSANILTFTAQVINDAMGAAIPGTEGTVFHPNSAASQALIWTPARVYRHTAPSLMAGEVKAAGSSITAVRGIVYSRSGPPAYAQIWNTSNVYVHEADLGTLNAQVVTPAISAAQGIVFNFGGEHALVWTPAKLYRVTDVPPMAQEVRENGTTSIASFDPEVVNTVQVVVHAAPTPGATGAGIVGPPATTSVSFTGSSTGAVVVPSSASPASHCTVLGAGAPLATGAAQSTMILGPVPVAGVLTGDGMKLFALGSPSPTPTPTPTVTPTPTPPNQCEVCHRRTQTIILPCNSLEYQRHLDHGDQPGACQVP